MYGSVMIRRNSRGSHAAGGANAMLGCDMVTAAAMRPRNCRPAVRAVINGQKMMTADFTRDPDLTSERRLRK